MKFIDLFAGLGGFHMGLSRLGHTCVFASEIDPQLRDIYLKNFGMVPGGDIREFPVSAIPAHDIICAGFPCQPYSKAGSQKGTECPVSGDLFERHVLRIIDAHHPRYVLLENVPNLLRHNKERTWGLFKESLEKRGYEVDQRVLSPHNFGVPQIRERAYIVGSADGLSHFEWPEP